MQGDLHQMKTRRIFAHGPTRKVAELIAKKPHPGGPKLSTEDVRVGCVGATLHECPPRSALQSRNGCRDGRTGLGRGDRPRSVLLGPSTGPFLVAPARGSVTRINRSHRLRHARAHNRNIFLSDPPGLETRANVRRHQRILGQHQYAGLEPVQPVAGHQRFAVWAKPLQKFDQSARSGRHADIDPGGLNHREQTAIFIHDRYEFCDECVCVHGVDDQRANARTRRHSRASKEAKPERVNRTARTRAPLDLSSHPEIAASGCALRRRSPDQPDGKPATPPSRSATRRSRETRRVASPR